MLKGVYSVVGVIGKGAFGFVVSAVHTVTGRPVAIKIIRSAPEFRAQAYSELHTLSVVQKRDPAGTSGIVRVLDYFELGDALYIVFERLSYNLYEVLQLTRFEGLSLRSCQRMATQVLKSLHYLSSISLIHCDIKPENVLLVHPNRSDVKLIDFSSCVFLDDTERLRVTYIQSRYYRAPEVLLLLPYGLPIDMWSLGCLLVEIHTGEPLFPGQSEREMIQLISATLGVPPASLLLRSRVASKYFEFKRSSGYSLLGPIAPTVRKRPLYHILKVDPSLQPGPGGQIRLLFLDFVSRMLRYKPDERLTPSQALQHPFLALSPDRKSVV